MQNNYIIDSGHFFKEISKRINKDITEFEVIQLTMNFAIGLEKFLKGLLSQINPTFILIKPDFRNSLQILYKDKILPETIKESSNEIENKSDSDVITFRNSILRAQFISKVTYENKNILFNLSEARDIIAHCELKLLDIPKYKTMLLRDFYPLLMAYSKETNIKSGHFFSGSHIKLASISSKLQENLVAEVALLLDSHNGKWKTLSGNKGYIEDKTKITQEILNTPYKEDINCPACENTALLYIKPIYESFHSKEFEVLTGFGINKLKCLFCKLEIKESKIIDFLNIKLRGQSNFPICSRCGGTIFYDNYNGLCDVCEKYYAKEH